MALELQAISKRVGQTVHIKETSLVLEPGRFNVLLGETGSGKTSLIKLMAGLDRLASGRILMNGQDVTGLSPQKRNISLVHQFFVNYPHMTVFENIASPLRVAGMVASEIQGRVEAAADVLRLRPMLHRRPHELSGGQQQRTALAGPSPRNPRLSSWTSRSPISTTSCARNCATSCPNSSPGAGRWWSMHVRTRRGADAGRHDGADAGRARDPVRPHGRDLPLPQYADLGPRLFRPADQCGAVTKTGDRMRLAAGANGR